MPLLAAMLSAVVTTRENMVSLIISLTCELVVKTNELTIVNLLQQVLKLLGLLTSLVLVNGSDVVVDVAGVVHDSHLLQSLELLCFGHALKGVGQSDEVLERASEVPSSLLVLTT